MQVIELFKTAIQSLRANKKRSFLTIIGIMIGIAAVIAILGIGDGITQTMYDKFGNNAKQGQQTTEIAFNPDNITSNTYGFTQNEVDKHRAQHRAEGGDIDGDGIQPRAHVGQCLQEHGHGKRNRADDADGQGPAQL